MIDSHAHLQSPEFDADRSAVIIRALEAGIEAIVNVGTDLSSSRSAVELARLNPGLFAAAGLHPTTVLEDLTSAVEGIRQLALSEGERVVAIGEIGLDYYWKEVPPDDQKAKLEAQLELARELDLPVILHCRDALGDLLALLESARERPAGVFHCFAGGADEARRALALGFHISFSGNVTYPRAERLRAAALAVPPDRLLLETDSPYLPPQERRGRRNEPSFGLLTRDTLANLHGMVPGELDRLTADTTRRLFKLPNDVKRCGG